MIFFLIYLFWMHVQSRYVALKKSQLRHSRFSGNDDMANNFPGNIVGRDVHGKVLLNSNWGQRWAFSMYAPLNEHSNDEGFHCRLGSESTAIAQIMYFHGLCPSGSVNYTAPGFTSTGMNFNRAIGLCDWGSFAKSPKNRTEDLRTASVAKYEYAAALVVQKKWGTRDYMITNEESSVEVESHFNVKVSVKSMSETTLSAMFAHIVRELKNLQPLKMFIKGEKYGHHVVVDGYRKKHGILDYHLNVGHSGYDNTWYKFGAPICLRHYSNGTTPADGACAYYYDDIDNFEFWSFSVKNQSLR